MGHGKDAAAELTADHREVEELFGKAEEDDLFPRPRAARSGDEPVKPGDKVRRTEKTAPTRPHPSARR